MYVAKKADAVYVLHAFQKKRKRPGEKILIWRRGATSKLENEP